MGMYIEMGFIKENDIVLNCIMKAKQISNIQTDMICNLVLQKEALYIFGCHNVIKLNRENMIKAHVKIVYGNAHIDNEKIIKNQELYIYYRSPDNQIKYIVFNTINPQQNSVKTTVFAIFINKEYNLFHSSEIANCSVIDIYSCN